jgi:hypothetical protein
MGFACCRARASELERDFAYGCVRQLLEPALARMPDPERDRLFEGAAALARPLFAPTAALAGFPLADTSFPMLHGLYWLINNLAAARPVVLSVDDLHWSDTESLRFLAYLAPRLDGLPVAVLASTRPEEGVAGELARLATAPETVALRLGPLSAGATATLCRRALGDVAPDFANIARDGSWLMLMCMAAYVISRSQNIGRARLIYRLLTPYAGQIVVNAGAVTFGGVTDNYLGLLAAALDQPDTAARHLDDAIAAYQRLGATLFLARACERRGELLAQPVPSPTPLLRRARLRRTPGEWECGYEGATFHVAHLVGLQHLARLLAAAGAEALVAVRDRPPRPTARRSSSTIRSSSARMRSARSRWQRSRSPA